MQNTNSGILSLISQIHSSTSFYLKKQLAERGLQNMASSHGNILFRLATNGPMTMSELTKSIHRNKSTTTVLVNKLEKSGYIQRKASDTDNRVTYIQLTDKGANYAATTADISEKLIARCYKGFSEKERQTVFDLVMRISANFTEDSTDITSVT